MSQGNTQIKNIHKWDKVLNLVGEREDTLKEIKLFTNFDLEGSKVAISNCELRKYSTTAFNWFNSCTEEKLIISILEDTLRVLYFTDKVTFLTEL